ncbi:unnamed protein product [Mytilus edulis]|uniref:Uncharacterized protein n=1 Tax=Mytilus edulis TaxID=6550 RepID=A0A8S3R7G0_MYTED|nr:unnamed protein product [Mytilus edulis]
MGLVFDHTECLLLPSVAATLTCGKFLDKNSELFKKLVNKTNVSISPKKGNYVFSGMFADLTDANTIIVNFIEDLRTKLNEVHTSLLFDSRIGSVRNNLGGTHTQLVIKEELETENMTRAEIQTLTEKHTENTGNVQIGNTENFQIGNTKNNQIENTENVCTDNTENVQLESNKSRFTRKENNKCRKKRKISDDTLTEKMEDILIENTEIILKENDLSINQSNKKRGRKNQQGNNKCRKKRKLVDDNQTENIKKENSENVQTENTENIRKDNSENIQKENRENTPKNGTVNIQKEKNCSNQGKHEYGKEKNRTLKKWRRKQFRIKKKEEYKYRKMSENIQTKNIEIMMNIQNDNSENIQKDICKKIREETYITWKKWRKNQLSIILQEQIRKEDQEKYGMHGMKRKMSAGKILKEMKCTETIVSCRLCQDETFFFKERQNFYLHMNTVHKKKFEFCLNVVYQRLEK